VLFDTVDLCTAVREIGRRAPARNADYVVTPNVDHVVRYQYDLPFRRALDAAWMRLADGMPIVWASRLLGRPLPERVTGSDLLPALCALAAGQGYSVFLCGGRRGVAQQAAIRLAARFPGLTVAGVYTPVDDFASNLEDQRAAVAAVNRATPDLVFVGLGAPAQELWVYRYQAWLHAGVVVCCGAALDYAAGVKPRAPVWMQRAGLEWLWRLAHEPRRLWRRYLVDDVAFVGIVLREWWRLRVRKAER
jgi:N-acetylglucosaminyldiphosphoundecaprenol N-acetyl-beta-D-mannosaminyltransferase